LLNTPLILDPLKVETPGVADSAQVFHPQEADVVSAFNQSMRILLSGAKTKHQIAIMEVDVPAQDGPPPHIHHDEDETFIVKKGVFEFWLNG
jgi:quercetin dioxygenase-like cupin family protein